MRTLHKAGARWGYPQSFLTDNGTIFTASKRVGIDAMEVELLSLGIASKHSRPYHPADSTSARKKARRASPTVS